MAKWVTRRTIDGKDVSEPRFCTEFAPLLQNTGVWTVDDCIRKLLDADERLGSDSDHRPILRGEQVVGFIDVTDFHP